MSPEEQARREILRDRDEALVDRLTETIRALDVALERIRAERRRFFLYLVALLVPFGALVVAWDLLVRRCP